MFLRIGVLKEIKPDENRVGLTPAGVGALTHMGHAVWVEEGAGEGSGFSDEEYVSHGAQVARTGEVYGQADIITKVKEPLPSEFGAFRPGQILYTYLHLAPAPELTRMLMERKVSAVAYETVQLADGSLPLLIPMSEVAGRMATQIGAQLLEKRWGGRGILLGGVPGVLPAKVAIVGGGIVGQNAATIALGMGADVTVLDVSPAKLRFLDDLFQGRVKTLMSTSVQIGRAASAADLLIGAVLIPGARAPKLVTEAMVADMQSGSVIVDVAIDQGGSVETIDRTTTHSQPTYVKHGVVHYAVANMPGAVPRTSTQALTNVTLPYLSALAQKGLKQAMADDRALRLGLNVHGGSVTCRPVAESLKLPYVPPEQALGI